MRFIFSILLVLFVLQLTVDFSQQFWDGEEIELADLLEEENEGQQEDEFFDFHDVYLYSSELTEFLDVSLSFQSITSLNDSYMDVYIQVLHSPPDNLN